MYLPAHFAESEISALHALIDRYPFGILLTHGKQGLDANHIPFELQPVEGKPGLLYAHVARANPVWQDVADGDEVLVVFSAGDAYISPNWYPSKHEFHKQVPTWNYKVAHVHGRITIHDDKDYVRAVVARLTRIHEASQSAPWRMSDSPKEFIDSMLAGIVGIEVEITRLVGKSKLSQNKEVRDILGAGQALKALGHHAIGEAMLACAERKLKREGT